MITKIPAPEYDAVKPAESGPTPSQRDSLLRAGDAIGNSLDWGGTAEGYGFWKGVCDRLRAIANGEPLK